MILTLEKKICVVQAKPQEFYYVLDDEFCPKAFTTGTIVNKADTSYDVIHYPGCNLMSVIDYMKFCVF